MRPITALLTAGFAALALPAAADPVRLMSYSDIFKDNYTETVITPFNATSDAKVEYIGSTSSAVMLGQLRTQKNDPQIDVIMMDTTTAAIACAEGLVEPVNAQMMPVLNELDPQATSTGGACGPGVTFDHFVIVYDTTVVSPAPKSLKELWDPKWKGRIGIGSPPNIQGLAMTAILAHADSGNWTKADGAFAQLKALAPSVQTFDPQPDSNNVVLNGSVTFSTGWNARGQLFHDRSNGKLGVMLPSEGTVFQINTINVVKNSKNHDAAMKFMAYALSAPAQKAFTERMFYGATNLKADISPAAASRTAMAPEYKSRVIPLDWSEMIKLRDNWNNRWKREVISAGAR